MITLKYGSVWLVLVVITAAISLLAVELYGARQSSTLTQIQVLPPASEFEYQTEKSDEVLLEEPLQAWFDNIKDSAAAAVTQSADYQALTPQEQTAIKRLLSRHYYKQKQYQDVTTLLASMTEPRRLQYELQFIYAYSLNRIEDSEAAIAAYKALLAASPNAPSAALNLGLIYRRNDQCEQAIETYQYAVTISSGNAKAKALNGLAECQYRLGDYATAAENYAGAIEYQPTRAELWMDLAKAQSALQRPYAITKDTLKKAISLDADNHLLLREKAELELVNLDLGAALASAEAALQRRSTAQAYRLKAWALLEMGKRSAASRAVNAALELNPSRLRLVELKAMQLYLQRDYDGLIAEFSDKKISTTKKYLLALAYRRSGRFEKMLATLADIADRPAFYWRAQVQATRVQRSRRQYTEAAESFRQLLAHSPDAYYLHFEFALVAEKLVRYPLALEQINQALARAPENRVYALTKARLQYEAGDPQSALQQLATLLASSNNYGRALKLQATIYSDLGDDRALIKTLEKIVELDFENADAHFQLAQALARTSSYRAALGQLQTTLELDASHLAARMLMAEIHLTQGENSLAVAELERILKLSADHNEAQILLTQLQQ